MLPRTALTPVLPGLLPGLLLGLLLGVAGCSGPVSEAPARLAASDVLRSWDRARADAFATGDVAALRGLYVPGSAAGTADVAVLRAYLDRGLRVQGMRMQVLSLDVLSGRPDDVGRLRLRVTDRLAGGAVVTGGRSVVPLPADAASTRVLELVRDGHTWRVASVRPVSG